MDDAPQTEPTLPDQAEPKPKKTTYALEFKLAALAAVDLNGGNVHRTAIAFSIPAATLKDWYDDRQLRNPAGRKERRGNLADKAEAAAHSIIESITPELIAKSTLLQRTTSFGILADHARKLRTMGLEPDPGAELCKLLGINRSQLPDSLQLAPGSPIPEGLSISKPTIDLAQDESGTYSAEPEPEPILSTPENCTDLNEEGSRSPSEGSTEDDSKLLDGLNEDDSAN